MVDEITRENVSIRLIEAVPEILQDYKGWIELSSNSDPGLYIVLGCYLIPYLLPLLKDTDESHDDALRRIFDFIERMATSGNAYIEDATAIEIGENLIASANEEQRARALRYMGIATRKMYDDMVTWRQQHGEEYRARAMRRLAERNRG